MFLPQAGTLTARYEPETCQHAEYRHHQQQYHQQSLLSPTITNIRFITNNTSRYRKKIFKDGRILTPVSINNLLPRDNMKLPVFFVGAPLRGTSHTKAKLAQRMSRVGLSVSSELVCCWVSHFEKSDRSQSFTHAVPQ